MTESIGEPLSTNLIERYLRARGRRYFRGHHDAEFFFVANAHLRLHVHLEISPAYRDVFTIRVSPAYFFPATDHTRLAEIVNAWNLQNHEVTAIVHGSSDPHRIRFDDFATFVDNAVSAATELFGQLTAAGLPPTATPPLLRDAG